MHFEFILASLAAFAAAAPMEMADDVSYGSYTPYKAYASYGPYSNVVDEEVEKMQNAVMHPKRDAAMRQRGNLYYDKYSSYKPYSAYGSYASAAEEEASNMDMGMSTEAEKREQMMIEAAMPNDAAPTPNKLKRHMPMSIPMEPPHLLEDTHTRSKKNTKRAVNHPDEAELPHSPTSHADATLPNNWYGKYNPYTGYGGYNRGMEGEADSSGDDEAMGMGMGKDEGWKGIGMGMGMVE
ncbi:hypothetical protein BKA66DRAFT_317600 [Pyrenochaeta sp. MPI-SDFR-AT-0127]|nr:hypothetical protein BKA66DRAFT_317600 [Pyrenochaeta sp. MPI-SDFR-AT-0127]